MHYADCYRKQGVAMIYDLQRASMLKRISAFILDAILLSIAAVFAAWLMSAAFHYDSYNSVVAGAYERYAAEYGITDEMTQADPSQLSAEQIDALNAASAAIAADAEAVHAYNMVIHLQLLMITFGLLFAFLLLEFAIPLILKNGQTIGKKVFGIGVMHLEGVRLGHVALFVRTVLGKYAVETMIPVLCVVTLINGIGSPVFLLITAILLIAQAVLLIATREHALLHDKMAVTVTVDLASQMIFNSRDELLEYKKKLHEEKAAKETY